ncbi:MAG: hypothetical protein JO159_07880 [Acidobacteria bacterium]|nr:hypothetical protein [Acidobacteriota bacterium]
MEDDPQALELILAPDFLDIVPARIITKHDRSLQAQHPSPGQRQRKHFEDRRVRVYGSVGIINGIVLQPAGE